MLIHGGAPWSRTRRSQSRKSVRKSPRSYTPARTRLVLRKRSLRKPRVLVAHRLFERASPLAGSDQRRNCGSTTQPHGRASFNIRELVRTHSACAARPKFVTSRPQNPRTPLPNSVGDSTPQRHDASVPNARAHSITRDRLRRFFGRKRSRSGSWEIWKDWCFSPIAASTAFVDSSQRASQSCGFPASKQAVAAASSRKRATMPEVWKSHLPPLPFPTRRH